MRQFIREENYAREMQERVLPMLAAVRTEGCFKGHGGASLFFARFDAEKPRGTVFIVHGFGESCEKYREMIAYFLEDGLSVFVYEQRGHARSHREVRAGLCFVRRFDDYVTDAQAAIREMTQNCPPPYYLLSHSMGGAVSARLLELGDHPFEKAALMAPMIALHRRGNIPPALTALACRTVCLLGGGKRKIPKMHEPDGNQPFARSSALSRARFDAYNALCKSEPTLFGGAPTFGWTKEAIGVTRRILKKGAPEAISIPVRVYSAELDHLVDNDAQQKFIARVPKGEFVAVKGCKHEIYGASDDILHPFLENLLDFLQ